MTVPRAGRRGCDDETTTGDQNPHLSITKEATATERSTAVGDVIHYTIVATNTGNMTLATVTVTDPNVSGSGLYAGERFVVGAGCVDDLHGDAHGHAGRHRCGPLLQHRPVSMTVPAGRRRQCDDDDVPAMQNPHLSITKVATEASYDAVGDVIHYTIVATNDGNMTLTAVTVTDPNVSDLVCTPANGSSLAPGASMTCTATHTVTQADIDAGHYCNTACVDDGAGGAAQVCDDVDDAGDAEPASVDHEGGDGDELRRGR